MPLILSPAGLAMSAPVNAGPLSGNGRAMLRDALRNHPDFASYIGDYKINDMTKDQLLGAAVVLGIDIAPFTASGRASGQTVAARYTDAELELAAEKAATELGFVPAPAPATSDVTAEAVALRRELSTGMIEGNFDAVTRTIEGLIANARKPAEIVQTEKVVYVAAPAGTDPALIQAAPVSVPVPSHAATWRDLFGITGPLGKRKINVFPATAQTPVIDAKYLWPDATTQAVLCALARGRNVWLFGPAGTGKSSLAEQLAARTGRPFFLLPCDDTTEAPELVGMTVPHQGGVRWQDGVLTAAMRTPYAVILIDEPTVARAGAVMVLQSVLASGVLTIKETGETVRAAEGVRFVVADNTNGTGGGTAEGYEGTRRMNRATLDRFSAFLRVDYMSADKETEALVSHSGCTPALAKILVGCAIGTRKARVTHALGLRRLIAWAEALTDGLDPRAAFESAILNSCARDDKEPTEQACALGLDKQAVKVALAGLPPSSPEAKQAETVSRSSAAADFA